MVDSVSLWSSLSGAGFPAKTGSTISIGLQPGLGTASAGVSTAGTVLGAKQGDKAVTTALKNATSAFSSLTDLQAKIADATSGGESLTADQTKALNDQIQKVAARIDTLSAGARVGNANLLTKGSGSVTIATQSGNNVRIATQDLTATSLNLKDLKIMDAESLRNATATVAKAAAQSQLTVFRLQTANGATSTTAAANPGLAAYDKIFSDAATAAKTGSAADSVAKAISNQLTANATSYSSTGTLNTTSGSSSSSSGVTGVLSVLA